MHNRISAYVLATLCLAIMTSIPTALAFSVSVGDINDQSDVQDLYDDVKDELDNELDDLSDLCDRGTNVNFADEQDNLDDDISDIYDEARDEASSSLDDDLDDDEDSLHEDVEDGIDDLSDQRCGYGNKYGNGYGYGAPYMQQFNPFIGLMPYMNYNYRAPYYTTVQTIGGYGYGYRPNCFNGTGSLYPTYLNQVPGYQNFNSQVCTNGPLFQGYGIYSS